MMSHNLGRNAGRESDGRVVPAKCPNKGGSLSPAEGLEGRRPTKENTGQRAASQMQSWGNALAGLHRVPEAAKREKQLRFTALLHPRIGHASDEQLLQPHICGESWKNGKFFVLRQTIRERLLAKLKQVKAALRVRKLQPLAEVGKWLKSVVQGLLPLSRGTRQSR